VTADSQTYMIDVPRLTLTSLQPILDLLRSPNIQKIVFDGRMDFSALYHELGVELQNVLDLQLVDIMSRFARGEGWETQRKRLRSFLKTDELQTRPQLYVQVHRLNGLDGCIAEHAVIPRIAGKPFKSKGEFPPKTPSPPPHQGIT
jgi:exonuclease 3'-5' domain-containing protein 1